MYLGLEHLQTNKSSNKPVFRPSRQHASEMAQPTVIVHTMTIQTADQFPTVLDYLKDLVPGSLPRSMEILLRGGIDDEFFHHLPAGLLNARPARPLEFSPNINPTDYTSYGTRHIWINMGALCVYITGVEMPPLCVYGPNRPFMKKFPKCIVPVAGVDYGSKFTGKKSKSSSRSFTTPMHGCKIVLTLAFEYQRPRVPTTNTTPSGRDAERVVPQSSPASRTPLPRHPQPWLEALSLLARRLVTCSRPTANNFLTARRPVMVSLVALTMALITVMELAVAISLCLLKSETALLRLSHSRLLALGTLFSRLLASRLLLSQHHLIRLQPTRLHASHQASRPHRTRVPYSRMGFARRTWTQCWVRAQLRHRCFVPQTALTKTVSFLTEC